MHPNHAPRNAAARTAPALLRDRNFGPWFVGLLVSNTGNWLFNVTAAIVVFDLSGSALQVGLVSVAQFAPLVLVAPLAGSLADRMDRRRLLLAAQSGAAVVAAVLAATALSGGIERFTSAAPIIAAAAGIGLAQAVSAPSLSALVPELVPDRDLENAVAMTSLTFNAGRAVGPAASGVLLATFGAALAFTVNAATFLVLIAALAVLQVAPRHRTTGQDRSVRAGLRYVRRAPGVLLLLTGVAATGFAADPMITLAPALAAEVGGSATLVAALVSAFGIAAAPAALLSGRLQRGLGSLRTARLGATLLACGLLGCSLAWSPTAMVAGFALTGVGFVWSLTGFTTVLQRWVPDELRGRVMALWSVAFLGNRPIAAAVDGAAADLLGPRLGLGIAIGVALSAVVIARRLARSTDAPEPDQTHPGHPH